MMRRTRPLNGLLVIYGVVPWESEKGLENPRLAVI